MCSVYFWLRACGCGVGGSSGGSFGGVAGGMICRLCDECLGFCGFCCGAGNCCDRWWLWWFRLVWAGLCGLVCAGMVLRAAALVVVWLAGSAGWFWDRGFVVSGLVW